MAKAANTRYQILEKAYELIYKKGYQTTSVDEIIATTNVTKGAFYYHFKTKDDMGLTIVKEFLIPSIQNTFIVQLKNTTDPLEEIYSITKYLLLEDPFLEFEYGCPIGNLIQEMTPWNLEFSKALKGIISEWQIAIENSLQQEIEKGNINNEISPKQVALFVLSSYWGIRNLGKIYNNESCYIAYLEELKCYLNKLK